jgi:hypothetical protein
MGLSLIPLVRLACDVLADDKQTSKRISLLLTNRATRFRKELLALLNSKNEEHSLFAARSCINFEPDVTIKRLQEIATSSNISTLRDRAIVLLATYAPVRAMQIISNSNVDSKFVVSHRFQSNIVF